jgi:hypothetical protein
MRCEYNEQLTRELVFDQPEEGKKLGSTCPNRAAWLLGKVNSRKETNRWALCPEHAALAIFKRLRSREALPEESLTEKLERFVVEGKALFEEIKRSGIRDQKKAAAIDAMLGTLTALEQLTCGKGAPVREMRP